MKALPPGPQPLGLPPSGTLSSFMTNASLDKIEALYGLAARNATASAGTYSEIAAVADSLGGYRAQYLGTLGELLKADAAYFKGYYVANAHGASNQPGPDVPTVTAEGVAQIVLNEVKLSAGALPYRIGASGLPKAYNSPAGLTEYIWGIILNPKYPTVVRARFKLALDEGNIVWKLTMYGNVRVKLKGTDRFPGDIEIETPITIPLK
jgi:hypothetical protein